MCEMAHVPKSAASVSILSRMRALIRRLRFEAWRRLSTAVLRLQGVDCGIEAGSPPRMDGWPRVRSLGGGGRLRIRLGSGVSLGRAVVFEHVRGRGEIEIGDQTKIDGGVLFRVMDGRHDPWEDNVDTGSIQIGVRSHIRAGSVMRSHHRLRIGDDVTISYYNVLHCGAGTSIGDRCTFAERVTTADCNHTFDRRHSAHAPSRHGPIEIGANVLVGAGAVITYGAEVRSGMMVGANAVVSEAGIS
jgi:acetyltransferase-like isoleucine patch superfamily enzyme